MLIQQYLEKDYCKLDVTLQDDIRYNHEGGVAIDTSDDALIQMMADTGIVRKENTLSIHFYDDGESHSHIVGYKTVKTIQHNQNDYTFIFLP